MFHRVLHSLRNGSMNSKGNWFFSTSHYWSLPTMCEAMKESCHVTKWNVVYLVQVILHIVCLATTPQLLDPSMDLKNSSHHQSDTYFHVKLELWWFEWLQSFIVDCDKLKTLLLTDLSGSFALSQWNIILPISTWSSIGSVNLVECYLATRSHAILMLCL